MEQRFLIDTNILVYYYEGLIPLNTTQEVDEILRQSFNISVISKIEFLGWPKYDEEQYKKAVLFIEGANIILKIYNPFKTPPLPNQLEEDSEDVE